MLAAVVDGCVDGVVIKRLFTYHDAHKIFGANAVCPDGLPFRKKPVTRDATVRRVNGLVGEQHETIAGGVGRKQINVTLQSVFNFNFKAGAFAYSRSSGKGISATFLSECIVWYRCLPSQYCIQNLCLKRRLF